MKKIVYILLILIQSLVIAIEISAKDIAREIFSEIDAKNWDKAERLAKNSDNSALVNIVLSQKFLDTNHFGNKFEEVTKFLGANKHWPQQQSLKEAAESYINNNSKIDTVAQWFRKNDPQTGNGYKYKAIAEAKLLHKSSSENNNKDITKIIKEGWIYGDFSKEEEKKYLANYGKFLTEHDHIQRINEHLWSEDIEEASRLIKKISENYQKSFAAEVAILKNKKNIDEIFSQINPKYYTSGLLYRYLLYKKKMKHEPDENILRIMSHIKHDYKHSEEWTKLLCYYAREYIEQKQYHAAYKVISKHFAIKDEDRREAEWLAGWIALSFLKKPEIALGHFHKFSAIAKRPMSASRGYYWLARAYEKNGEIELANKFYADALKYSYTFYGQLASVELGINKINLPAKPKIHDHHFTKFEKNDIIIAAKLFLKYGKPELAHLYAKAAISEASSDGEVVLITDFIKNNYNVNYMVDIAKIASQHNVFIRDYSFPVPYKINNDPVEAALVYSIIRQESVFNTYAVSNRNAMGLMQMIKDTACRTAKSLNMKCEVPKLTKDPKYNMKLGSHHLKDLLEEKKGSYLLTIASYDTAPKNINKWIKLFGDPRDLKSTREVVDWIESIPFSETRNYVQRVMENLQVYRAILKKDNVLRLKKDLISS